MNLFYKKGSSRAHKIFSIVVMLIASGPIYWAFTHDFVVNPSFNVVASYTSAFLTLVSLFAMAYLFKRKLIHENAAWYGYSRVKKILWLPVFVLLFYFVFWVTLEFTLPHIFTDLFGKSFTKIGMVEKHRGYNRKSCRYRLKLVSADTNLFHYCISKELHNKLPKTAMEAKLDIRQSVFGYIVKDIKILNVKH